jgi:polyphenol oxidase
LIRLALPGAGGALFSERSDGNLSTMRGEGHERGGQERDRLCEQLGLDWLCAGPQVHGNTVQRVRVRSRVGGQAVELEADGHATGLSAVGMMVLTADCLPVLVGSGRSVAALHAGWRGLAGGVLEEGVRALRELDAGAEGPGEGEEGAGEISAVIGPGAGPCCYEVGAEVHAAFAGRRPGAGSPAAAPIDLKAIARERLLAAGVSSVEDVGLCTICDERFFSHRREAGRAGRQAGVVWLS